jgi:hypothetical protein
MDQGGRAPEASGQPSRWRRWLIGDPSTALWDSVSPRTKWQWHTGVSIIVAVTTAAAIAVRGAAVPWWIWLLLADTVYESLTGVRWLRRPEDAG